MQAKELAVGDWVHCSAKGENTTVQGVRIDGAELVLSALTDVWYYVDNYEPIPLTSDILERSGFEKIGGSPLRAEYRLEIDDENDKYLFVTLYKRLNSIRVCFQPIEGDVNLLLAKKNYAVHDLQHILRMCGIEKEIVL